MECVVTVPIEIRIWIRSKCKLYAVKGTCTGGHGMMGGLVFVVVVIRAFGKFPVLCGMALPPAVPQMSLMGRAP